MRDDVGRLQVAVRDAVVVRELHGAAGDAAETSRVRPSSSAPTIEARRAGSGRSAAPSPGYGRSSASRSKSRIETMCGWRSCAHARLSRRKRSRSAPQRLRRPAPRCRTLIATSSPSSSRRARYISPIPPSPSRLDDLVAAVDHVAGGQHRVSLSAGRQGQGLAGASPRPAVGGRRRADVHVRQRGRRLLEHVGQPQAGELLLHAVLLQPRIQVVEVDAVELLVLVEAGEDERLLAR